MKSRDSLIRLKRFGVDEKRRQVAQIEAMMAEFSRMAGELDAQIANEQERVGIHDITHFAYPTYAKAAIQRRDNLRASIDELKAQLQEAQDALTAAFEELKRFEIVEERDQERERQAAAARDQAVLDEVAGAMRRAR